MSLYERPHRKIKVNLCVIPRELLAFVTALLECSTLWDQGLHFHLACIDHAHVSCNRHVNFHSCLLWIEILPSRPLSIAHTLAAKFSLLHQSLKYPTQRGHRIVPAVNLHPFAHTTD